MTCRLCLDKPAEVMEIFDENGGLVEGGAIEIIEKYFQIQIQFRDEISNKICLVCWRYLKEFHKFWLNIKEKQRILQIALDCTRIQGKATEDDSYAQKNSTIDRKNDIFSEPELNIVDIKNEPNLAEEFDDDCMNEDSPLLSPQASDANKVTVDRLKYLCVEDIKDMIPAIGIRAEFRSKLLTWKKREFEIDDENISIVTPIKSWLSESQRPDESLSNPSVRTILEAQDNGRAILDFFKANRFIMEVHRQELIVLLLENFFACNLKLQCKDFSYIVQQIINIFPTEKKDYYFIPRGPRKNPGGKLYDKYHNFKTKRRKIQKCLTSYEEKCDVEEFDEVQLIELKNSLKSEPALSIIADNGGFTISDVWKRTLPLRQKGPRWTNDNNDFLHEWPSFKQAFGYKLIEYDFDEKYPDRGNKLLEKWTTFKHQIRKFYEVNIKDTKSREEFSVCKEIRNSSGEDYILAKLLNSVIVPTARFKKPNGEARGKFTISDGQESFALYLTCINNYKTKLNEIRKKCIETNATTQPTVIVVGPTQYNLKKFYLSIDEVLHEFDSFPKCLSACFKTFHILNLPYPSASQNAWLFIQQLFFEIETEFDNPSPALSTVVNFVRHAK
ncbi:PREDICTED: uncharacterized protein LOC108367993 isoform X2 [Rhagoletis zephyria]|uniref:uncharacterized protein LOC108367993 isoform X2 n=1 Tax=Rhagoletis zephyria TaxID=28612 RepID=UPI00081199ED|nr:PREDICTED: uncharacterized protein LOC108367993 isoform X2 [Rhagoletis zephyria]